MRTFFSRLFSRSIPQVCADCEGGSGANYDETSGILRVCTSCAGSGQAFAAPMPAGEAPIIDLAAARLARAKAQHEARKVA